MNVEPSPAISQRPPVYQSWCVLCSCIVCGGRHSKNWKKHADGTRHKAAFKASSLTEDPEPTPYTGRKNKLCEFCSKSVSLGGNHRAAQGAPRKRPYSERNSYRHDQLQDTTATTQQEPTETIPSHNKPSSRAISRNFRKRYDHPASTGVNLSERSSDEEGDNDSDKVSITEESQSSHSGEKDESESFSFKFKQRSTHILRLVDIAPDLGQLLLSGRQQLMFKAGRAVNSRRKDNSFALAARDRGSFSLLCELVPGLREELLQSSNKDSEIGENSRDTMRLLPQRKREDSSTTALEKCFAQIILIGAAPENLEAGLFKNNLLLRIFKFLFTGRSSALSQLAGWRSSARLTNAQLAGMKEVTPRAIAYCACLFRFSVSDKESWSLQDDDFDMHAFYWNIVDVFDDAEFSADVLSWWNEQVFGTKSSQTNSKRRPDEMSTLERMKVQRAAKRARQSRD
ncbi:hypothetical protein EW145_g1946 [Phellinidium pouzarii]|uniref:Uncharacterized protein n=1 Tax=Phellinidium pouzarii TaxID=167371 RepID=A0A4S4LD45_9AGAM|nr:hypothetical protein EW145_g1946 [Phellinidium pouzarii]